MVECVISETSAWMSCSLMDTRWQHAATQTFCNPSGDTEHSCKRSSMPPEDFCLLQDLTLGHRTNLILSLCYSTHTHTVCLDFSSDYSAVLMYSWSDIKCYLDISHFLCSVSSMGMFFMDLLSYHNDWVWSWWRCLLSALFPSHFTSTSSLSRTSVP